MMKTRWRQASAVFLALTFSGCGGDAQHATRADGSPEPVDAGGSAGMGTPPSAGGATAGNATTAAGSTQVDTGSAGFGDGGSFDGGGSNAGGPDTGGADAGGADAGGADAGGGDAGAAGQPPANDCDPIIFEDPELERTVRDYVQKPTVPLTGADVVGLTVLTTPTITSLKGVECLTNLTDLDFGSLPPSTVTDLSPLASLTNLETLSLSRNPVASLEPLGKLPKLQTVYMFKMPVVLDLAPLATAPQLDVLYMDGDTVEDLAPLGSVTTLRQLSLRNGVIENPSGLSALFSVEDLDLTAVLTDLSPLAGLSKLQKLRVGNQPLTHLSSIVGLIKLQFLDLSQAGLTDIAALGGLTQLRGLNLASNQVTSIAPLADLTELNSVVLAANQITDVAPLAGNAGIGEGDFVYLNQNPLVCVNQAANLKAMTDRGAEVTSDCP